MIKTIAILGAGKRGSAIAQAFARTKPDGYMVDMYDPNPVALENLRKQIDRGPRKENSVWFSTSYHAAAWGADVLVLDLPSSKLLPALKAIGQAPNTNALVMLAQDPTEEDAETLKKMIKKSDLKLVSPDHKKMIALWQQAELKFDKI